jgi:uncharacterized protein YdbL (DUF1318 family)
MIGSKLGDEMNRTGSMIFVAMIAISSAGAAQSDAAAQLRASGEVGEQADGYLGIVGLANQEIRQNVDAVNIKRRAYYTQLAAEQGVKIEEFAATMACRLLRRVSPGQYYRLPDGVWHQRNGDAPITLPGYCG